MERGGKTEGGGGIRGVRAGGGISGVGDVDWQV